jgi:hypothetical protein
MVAIVMVNYILTIQAIATRTLASNPVSHAPTGHPAAWNNLKVADKGSVSHF